MNETSSGSSPTQFASPASVPPKQGLGFWGCLFRSLLVLVVVAALGVGGFVFLSKNAVDVTKATVAGIADAFTPDQIAQTFVEWRELQTKATDGNILEVATSRSTEHMTRKTNLMMFERVLPMGTTVSEITVPATYRFHIDLNGDWFVTAQGQRVLVIAPKVAPSLPVAFNTGSVRKMTKSGWARWDKDENLEELEKSITTTLAIRASAPETLAKVRNEAREAVAKFVQKWLLSRDHWDTKLFNEIVIVFEDEVTGPDDPALLEKSATLKLDVVPAAET
jgi:hypothetical protein